ncbi:unnamed protein product [Cochlearia groenlandica]
MGINASTDPKPENLDSQSQTNEAPSEKSRPLSENLVDSSPTEKSGDPSENLGDSSTIWREPEEEGSDQTKEGDADGEEEEGECGFCLFMKGGGCKESFTAWEVCIEEAEKNKEDIVTKCMEVTSTLKKCMDVHSDYYQPILAAEKAAEEQVKKELEAEKISEEEEEEVLEKKKEAQA